MSELTLKLEKKVFITGDIIVRTGLHIGGSSLGLAIGGADKVVVRNPLSNLPYIPGSSLKGKMRSLLEKANNLVQISQDAKTGNWKGPICDNLAEPVVQLFGAPAEAAGVASPSYAPTRLTVRDGDLLNEVALAAAENTDMYCTEVKTEVNIDRLTSAANPRNFERVPAGARFRLDLVLDVYNVDLAPDKEGKNNADRFLELIREGLMLVEDTSLGGQGSRGYGQVEFEIKSVTERTAQDYRNGTIERQKSEHESLFQAFRREAFAEV